MAPLAPLPYQRFAYTSELGSWEFLLAPPPPDLVGIVEAFWISRGRIAMLYEKILPQLNANPNMTALDVNSDAIADSAARYGFDTSAIP